MKCVPIAPNPELFGKPVDMHRQHQTKFGKGQGNCFSTCIACLLGVPVDNVPNFCVDRPSRWCADTERWLQSRGWTAVHFRDEGFIGQIPAIHPGLVLIASGKGPRGSDHSVLLQDGVLLHDPHPDDTGLLKVEMATILLPLDPRNSTPSRTMTEGARLKAKEAIRRLRVRMEDTRIDDSLYAHGMGQESTMNEVGKPALAIIAELCSAIETCHLHETNEYIENARKRARDFLEANK